MSYGRIVEAGKVNVVEKPLAAQADENHLESGTQVLRGQTKKEGLATVEAIVLALDCLGENKEIGAGLRKQYEELIIKPNR